MGMYISVHAPVIHMCVCKGICACMWKQVCVCKPLGSSHGDGLGQVRTGPLCLPWLLGCGEQQVRARSSSQEDPLSMCSSVPALSPGSRAGGEG